MTQKDADRKTMEAWFERISVKPGLKVPHKDRSIPYRIWYRTQRFLGEVTAIILALGVIWLFALNILLDRQKIDVTGLRSNAQLWFSQAYGGRDAEIGQMDVEWLSEGNNVRLVIRDVNVKDADAMSLQQFRSIVADVPLAKASLGQFMPDRLDVKGGSVTWRRFEDGSVTAGLGTPETVGRLGPVWKGRKQTEGTKPSIPELDNLSYIRIEDATVFVRDDRDGFEAEIKDAFVEFSKLDARYKLHFAGQIHKDDQKVPILFHGETDKDFNNFDVGLQVENANLNKLAPETGRLAVFEALNLPLNTVANIKMEDGEFQQIEADISSGAGTVNFGQSNEAVQSFALKAFLNPGDEMLQIETVKLDAAKAQISGSGILSELGAMMDGDINSSPLFDISLEKFGLDLTPQFENPLDFDKVDVKGRLDLDDRHLFIEELIADLGGFVINTRGEIVQDRQGDWKAVQLDGHVTGVMQPDDLLDLWPALAAEGARSWIKRSVIRGVLKDIEFKLNLDKSHLVDGAIPDEDNLYLAFAATDADVRYISTMTHYTNTSGSGTIRGNRLDFDVIGGQVGSLLIDEGRVEIPRLRPKGGDFTIDLTGQGDVVEMLQLIDQKPFEFPTRYGISPTEFGGSGKIEMRITRPLLVHFDQDRIRYEVSGLFENASAPFSFGPHKLRDGRVSLNADKTKMVLAGPVKIGPWQAELNWQETFDFGQTPTQYRVTGKMGRKELDGFGLGFREYLDGELDVEIDAEGTGLELSKADIAVDLADMDLRLGEYWRKDKGQPGSARATLSRDGSGGFSLEDISAKADGLELAGRTEFAENFGLIDFDLGRLKIDGVVDAAIKVKPDTDREALSMMMTGNYLDVSPMVSGSLQNTNTQNDWAVPLLVTASLNKLALNEAYILENANLLFSHNGTGFNSARLEGETQNGSFKLDMQTKDDGSARTLVIDIADASRAAAAFFNQGSISGGHLKIKAEMPSAGLDGAMTGHVRMDDFTLTRAPVLAQMLSLGSLTGLFDTLGGSGLRFDKLDMPFTWRSGKLEMREARMSGPALGMTGNGEIHIGDKTVDMDGILVPAYSTNSLLGDVPVIGDIFVGKKGEGIFALNYLVKGSFQKTQISVNPLSALTPGFLRGIFKKERADMPEMGDVAEKTDDEKEP